MSATATLRTALPRSAYLLIAAAFAALCYAYARRWDIAYSSDVAMIGLMGKHIAEFGERPIFVWSVGYQGVFIEAYLAALFFKIWGVSPVTTALAPMVSLCLALVAWGVAVARAFDRTTAYLTVFLTVVSCPFFYHLNTRTLPNFAESFLIGSLFLWAYGRFTDAVFTHRNREAKRAIFLAGILCGFGAYIFLVSQYYVLAAACHLLFLMVNQEHRETGWRIAQNFCRPYLYLREGSALRAPFKALITFGWVNFAFGFVTFLFSWDRVTVNGRLIKWEPIANLYWTLVGLTIFSLLFLSRRYFARGTLARALSGLFAVGVCIGYSPALYHKLVLGGRSAKGIAVRGTLDAVLMKFGFLVHTHKAIFNFPNGPLSLFVVVFSLLGIFFFLWTIGRRHLAYFRGETVSSTFHRQSPLFFLPFVLWGIFLSASMVVDECSSRYLVFLVSIYALCTAFTLVQIWRRYTSSIARMLLATALGLLLTNTAFSFQQDLTSTAEQRESFDQMIAAMESKNLRLGYADYWIAYAINLMTNERIMLEPIYSNYSPHYGPQVAKEKRIGYLAYAHTWVPEGHGTVDLYGTRYQIRERVPVNAKTFLYVLEK